MTGLVVAAAFSCILIGPAAASGPLQFTPEVYPEVREGYVTLAWKPVASAVEYQILGASGEIYRGPLPAAFVSGLPNGTHLFDARAIDDQGRIIAVSQTPATVEVEHWTLGFALLLLGAGLIVSLAVAGLILGGTLLTRNATGHRTGDEGQA